MPCKIYAGSELESYEPVLHIPPLQKPHKPTGASPTQSTVLSGLTLAPYESIPKIVPKYYPGHLCPPDNQLASPLCSQVYHNITDNASETIFKLATQILPTRAAVATNPHLAPATLPESVVEVQP